MTMLNDLHYNKCKAKKFIFFQLENSILGMINLLGTIKRFYLAHLSKFFKIGNSHEYKTHLK